MIYQYPLIVKMIECSGTLNTEDQNSEYEMFDIFRTAGEGVDEYTAKVKIDYSIKDTTFESRDFIIINI